MSSVADFLAAARSKVGVPYVFGATGPNAFDCSGLVQWAAKQAGQSVPRTTYEQVKVGTPVQRGEIQPGDLIFSTWEGGQHPGHVGIYVGDGKILSAPQAGKPVGYSTLNDTYWSHVDSIRRLPLAGGGGGGGGAGGGTGLPIVDGLTGAVQSAANGLKGIAGGAKAVGDLAGKLMWFALPTTQVRLVTGGLGVGFIVVGIVFLARELRS